MNLSTLSSFLGIFLLGYGIAGLLFIALSFPLGRRIPLQGIALTTLRTQAAYWHIPEAALEDISHAQGRLYASLSFGFGLGSLLFSLISTFLVISPAWSRLCTFSIGAFSNSIWFFTCIIGASGGGIYTFYSLRHEARSGRPTGPQRTLNDYRSPLFFLVPIVWLALSCTLVIAFHPSYLPPNNCPILRFPPPPWQWGPTYVWLGLAVVALFTIELLLSRIASTPSPLVPSNLPDPGALDDMFRSKIINLVQSTIFSQIFAFSISLPLISGLYAFIPLLFSVILFFFSNLALTQSFRGLGGKLTGWFWQTKRTT